MAVCLTACNPNLDSALEQAGENREELEKALEHFKDDPDTLKYSAAKFLIENMPYHYGYYGNGVKAFDSIYSEMLSVPKSAREKYYNELAKTTSMQDMSIITDIKKMKSDELISIVEDACKLWHSVSWSKEYDINFFFDYVLSYRVYNESLSNWHNTIDKVLPYLSDKAVMSCWGIVYEAESKCNNGVGDSCRSASGGAMVMLGNVRDSVCFDIHNELHADKMLYLHYATVGKKASVRLKINGRKQDNLGLETTGGMNIFRTMRNGRIIHLNKGENHIVVQYNRDSVALDYLVLTAYESYDQSRDVDFSSSYCRISNVTTGCCIAIDTARAAIAQPVKLVPVAAANDSLSMLRLDYLGNACWSVKSFKKNDMDFCMEVYKHSTEEGAPMTQYLFKNALHQKWIFLPIGDKHYKIMNKNSGQCLETIKTSDGRDSLVQSMYAGRNSQKWNVDKLGINPYGDITMKYGSAVAYALKAYDITGQFEWFPFNGPIPPSASLVCYNRTGNCREEASYTTYLCRHLGIPSTVDFIPHWGNRSLGHTWPVIIRPDGKSVPFYMGSVPGDTTNTYHGYVKPKVFRHRFRLNRQMADDLSNEKSVPSLFIAPDFVDVTDDYFATTDVVRSVPNKYADKKVAYICVSEKNEWIPVFYGKVDDGKVLFKSMGRNIVYLTAFYENGQLVPFGCPFRIDADGNVIELNPSTRHKQTLNLLRKHPFFGLNANFNSLMNGGCFQAANRSDFKDTITLHVHHGITTGNWYDIPVNSPKTFKYIRYLGARRSWSNINELAVYDEHGHILEGEVIGTEGTKGHELERAFDHDILTGYQAKEPDNQWVGLRLKHPSRIGKIRYMPRTDGNCIEVGDTYVLYYWKSNKWTVIGKQKATSDVLIFRNVPTSALFLLSNISKGVEERIFTYEDGKQVWW